MRADGRRGVEEPFVPSATAQGGRDVKPLIATNVERRYTSDDSGAEDATVQRVSRREFLAGAGVAGLGLLAGCGRLPWQAQPPKSARVGYVGTGDASNVTFEAFRQGLRELGYVEGDNLVFEARWAEGMYERYPAFVAELVTLQPDVIVSTHTPQAQLLQQATSTIPVVFIALSDPVGSGLIDSLARPGRNLTGTSDLSVGLSGKRLELLLATLPGASRVGIFSNPTNTANALDLSATQDAARALGVAVLNVAVRTVDELPSAFETIIRERADAAIMLGDSLFGANATPQFADLVARSRLPTMHYERSGVVAGGLMGYGPSRPALFRRGSYYVDRILKGAKPADLPVEQPMIFDFVVNMKTASGLGITFPPEILLQVTEVIE
jgi:putative ABC transport system substrate-binding protein